MEVKKTKSVENMDNKVEQNENNNLESAKGKSFNHSTIEMFKKLNKKAKIFIILLIIIAILCLILSIKNSETGKLKILAESSLEKIVEKNDLETVNYTYNAIARQCKKDSCSKDSENTDDYKYFVSYEGTVSAGIDFKQVKIEVNEKEKKLIITIPEPKITGYNVDIGSMKFIFTKDKYNEASELEKAFKLCKEDLKTRSDKDELILKTAKQNSITVLEAFFEPWIETFNSEYEVEVK